MYNWQCMCVMHVYVPPLHHPHLIMSPCPPESDQRALKMAVAPHS